MRAIAKSDIDSSYNIIEDGKVVGYIDRTEDKLGYKCWGVFFSSLPPKFFGSFASAKAVAQYYKEGDFYY